MASLHKPGPASWSQLLNPVNGAIVNGWQILPPLKDFSGLWCRMLHDVSSVQHTKSEMLYNQKCYIINIIENEKFRSVALWMKSLKNKQYERIFIPMWAVTENSFF